MAKNTVSGGGVYVITTNIDGRVYVGSTVNFKSRFKTHRTYLNTGRHNYLFQPFWNEHRDRITLTFTVLEAVAEVGKEFYQAREQFWLDHYRSYDPDLGFNTHPSAFGPRGMSQTTEWVAKRVAKQVGQKRSAEFSQMMSLMKLGTRQSDETKAKRSAAMVEKPQRDKRRMTYDIAVEIRRLCEAEGISQQGVADRLGISRGMVRDVLARRTYANP